VRHNASVTLRRLADVPSGRAADLALVDLLVGLALQVLQLLVDVLGLALLGALPPSSAEENWGVKWRC
jgi:hypothetical protein